MIIPTVAQESQNNKFSFKLIYKNNQIIRSLEIYKINKNKLKFNIKKKIIYSFSIFGFVIILGLLLFFISQSKKNESTITNKSILLEKKILIF